MIGFSRVSSSGKSKFFGSDLPVNNYIEITIQLAQLISHGRQLWTTLFSRRKIKRYER